jgi:hypothetical protein
VEAEPPTAERLHHLARLLKAVGQESEARARTEQAENLAAFFPCPMATA